MARSSFERTLHGIWYGDSSGVSVLLRPLAWLFGGLVALRRWAYRAKLIARHKVPVPVVVIGNISVGGTGKTPLVEWLAVELTARGYRPGIVSRGYGAKLKGAARMVTTDSRVEEVGDEPLLLARRTGVPVCVCAERVRGAELLVTAGVNLIIADDGLQHYRLARDVEIAVIDGQRGLGNGLLLPAGPLREPPSRLTEVDFVFVNGADALETGYRFDLLPGDAVPMDGGKSRALSHFHGQRVWSLAGIGNPERFHEVLSTTGIDGVPVDVPDHGFVSLPELRKKHPWPILMTEKDAVKYPDAPLDNLWYIPVVVQLSDQARQAVLDRITAL